MKKNFVLFILLVNFTISYSQVDSIEYNYWGKIFQFKIDESKFFFHNKDGALVEFDSLVFNVDRYFQNYPLYAYTPSYVDSVQLTIASRTLRKFYNEPILFNKDSVFIRLCWLKEKYPVVLFLSNLDSENIYLRIKFGNGNYDRHGTVLFEKEFCLSDKESLKIKRMIANNCFLDFKNGVVCPTEAYLPNVFFFEYKNADGYNVIVVNECNLDRANYFPLYDLYNVVKKIVESRDGVVKKGEYFDSSKYVERVLKYNKKTMKD